MKIVILAGGMQSILDNEREGIPKPMVYIGDKPLLWHIMKHFSEYDLTEFIICGGYKVDIIKEYFMDFYIYQSDITVDLSNNTIEVHKKKTEDWKVTVVDTGLYSTTGQRVAMIQNYISDDEFIVTYGDCLSDINLHAMQKVHRENGKIATIAMAKPTGRSQLLPLGDDGTLHYDYAGTIKNDTAWVSAGCMIFNREVFNYLQGHYDLEKQLLIILSNKQHLTAYKHDGYWTAVETKRDLSETKNLWNAGMAPWIKCYDRAKYN